jgi:hypothetical protein
MPCKFTICGFESLNKQNLEYHIRETIEAKTIPALIDEERKKKSKDCILLLNILCISVNCNKSSAHWDHRWAFNRNVQ